MCAMQGLILPLAPAHAGGQPLAKGDNIFDIENPPPRSTSERQHFVLVIHGTFGGPKEDRDGRPLDLSKKWWAPEGGTLGIPFCAKLRDALAEEFANGKGPVPGDAVWGDIGLPTVEFPFYWGAKNSDASREEGAQKLAQRILSIREAQPNALVHLIAHSHGGNVVLRAVEIILGQLGEEGVERLFGGLKPFSCWQKLCSTPKNLADKRLQALSQLAAKGPAVDFLTGLGAGLEQATSMRAQNEFVRQHYPSLGSVNPLGRLVFLGTPFLRKPETPRRELVLALLWLLVAVGTTMATILLTALRSLHGARAAGIVMLCCCFVLAFIVDSCQGKLDPLKPFRPDTHGAGNVYHLTKQRWSENMAALVVHSGILDEANFTLRSTAPLVQAYVVPEVDGYFDLQPWKSLPKKLERAYRIKNTVADRLPWDYTPCGHPRKALFGFEIMLYSCLIAVLSFFVRLLLLPLVFLTKRVLIKGLQSVLLRVVLGTGSAERSVSGAKVKVSEHLVLDQLAQSSNGEKVPEGKAPVVHWNVQRVILDNSESFGSSTQKEPPFDFLLEPERAAAAGDFLKVEARGEASGNSVIGALVKAGCFDGLEEADRQELLLIAQMLEERQKEITGQVEVRHSLYYTKGAILQAIAKFLQVGATSALTDMLTSSEQSEV